MFGNFARTVLIAASVTGLASANIVGVTDPGTLGANDFIDWGQLGVDGDTVSSPAAVTSNHGNTGSASTEDPDGFARLDEGGGWDGNFTIGDKLLTSFETSLFPLTITFDTPIFGAGANIQQDTQGAFTAQIQAFNGATLLETFTEDGTSNANEDGSAIFIGLLDDTQEITSITFTLTSDRG